MAIAIERQIPERGMRGLAAAPAGDCCCCCCCCLHSVGGVLGAITTKPPTAIGEPVPISAINGAQLEPKASAAGLYTKMVLVVCLAVSVVAAATTPREAGAVMTFWLVMAFPVVQLLASLLAAIAIKTTNRLGKAQRMRDLGRITKRAFLGALIGGTIMTPVWVWLFR